MTHDAVLQELHKGKHLAASVAASRPENLAWVGIYPLEVDRPDTHRMLNRFGIVPIPGVRIYRMRFLEVSRALLEEDACISEEDLNNRDDSLAIGDQDLIEKLEKIGIRLEQLDLPFKSDYPI